MSTCSHDRLSPLRMCKLFIRAFFFALRSCKYVNILGPRKTKLRTISNVRFFIQNKLTTHDHRGLHLSDCISLTFESQKWDTKYDVIIITQHISGVSFLCPVKNYASILRHISSNQSTIPTASVNTYLKSDITFHLFSGKELRKQFRLAATSIGPATLGF